MNSRTPPAAGEIPLDVDLSRYLSRPDSPAPPLIPLDQVDPRDVELMAEVGVALSGLPRSATYVQRDFYPLCLAAQSDELALLPLAVALERYDWLRENYYWQAVPADLNAYTAACAAVPEPQGFFLYVKRGASIALPVQACLYMTRPAIVQSVHNIIVLEEDAELHLITGCANRSDLYASAHLGVTESYLAPRARLTSTMVHQWNPQTEVRPHSGTIVEAGAVYVENYCCLRPARSVVTQPRTWLNGQGASATYTTIVVGAADSVIETGGEIYLNGADTTAELAHRAVCMGGRMYQRGLLVGNNRCRAHVDCAGMIVASQQGGFIQSIPGLQAGHPEARMSHEASIGKIAPEQVEYLQTRGMDEREAISLIIRGFLGADIIGLGPELDARIAEIAELAGHGEER